MQIEISKEQYEAWRVNPITEEVFRGLKDFREGLKELMAVGQTLNISDEIETFGKTSRFVGIIQGLDSILNIYFEEE